MSSFSIGYNTSVFKSAMLGINMRLFTEDTHFREDADNEFLSYIPMFGPLVNTKHFLGVLFC